VQLLITGLATTLLVSSAASRQLTAVHVAEGQDLQKALNAAKAGDTILLARGARFQGNFVLPVHAGDGVVTIRTESGDLPREGTRVTPRSSGELALIQSPNNSPALRTARAAHHWRIENVEFGANRKGDGNIIDLGSDDQRDLADVPHSLVLDRVYIHGDALIGQKRGIALNSASTQIINSYISDIKALGVDTQAIAGWNGPGPYVIENNYLEATGENVLFGGADPNIEGLVPADIAIRRNHISRPVEWRDAIVAKPAGVRAMAGAQEGTLPAGTYAYRVVAERPVAGGDAAFSEASAPAEGSVARAPGSIKVEWAPVAGAAAYRVYRSGGAGGDVYWPVMATTFADDGAPGQAGVPPKRASVWTVKNLLELKNARNVEIDGNVFEHHWPQAQSGHALVLTPRNQSGRAPWSIVENVSFINNVVRHVSGGFNISGTDDYKPSGRTRGLVIRNNLFTDVGGRWGGPGDFVQIGNGPLDIRIESNTVDHTGRMISVYGSKHGTTVEGLVFRNNVLRHNKYGVIGGNAAPGNGSFQMYFPDAVFVGNVIAGGEVASYPKGNRFIADDAFDAQFVAPATGDFHLKAALAAVRGAPEIGLGADIDTVNSAVAGVAQPTGTTVRAEETSRR
jgi:hypothetical protein